MIKWDLVLGEEAFYYLIHRPRMLERGREVIKQYQDLLEQHNIVLSSSLRDLYGEYYYKNAIDELDEFETFFDELVSYSHDEVRDMGFPFVEASPIKSDSINDMLSQTADLPVLTFPIIICDSISQTKRITSNNTKLIISRLEVLEKKLKNKIYRNSIIFTKDMKPEDFSEFITWLKEIFCGEQSVDIFDPYLYSDRGLKVFNKYYINNIAIGARLNIYTACKKTVSAIYRNEFWSKAQKRNIKARIFIVEDGSEDYDFHERRIYFNTSQRHLAIGHGIDSIRVKYDGDGKGHEEMRDCHLTIDDDMEYRKTFFKRYKYSEIKNEIVY